MPMNQYTQCHTTTYNTICNICKTCRTTHQHATQCDRIFKRKTWFRMAPLRITSHKRLCERCHKHEIRTWSTIQCLYWACNKVTKTGGMWVNAFRVADVCKMCSGLPYLSRLASLMKKAACWGEPVNSPIPFASQVPILRNVELRRSRHTKSKPFKSHKLSMGTLCWAVVDLAPKRRFLEAGPLASSCPCFRFKEAFFLDITMMAASWLSLEDEGSEGASVPPPEQGHSTRLHIKKHPMPNNILYTYIR